MKSNGWSFQCRWLIDRWYCYWKPSPLMYKLKDKKRSKRSADGGGQQEHVWCFSHVWIYAEYMHLGQRYWVNKEQCPEQSCLMENDCDWSENHLTQLSSAACQRWDERFSTNCKKLRCFSSACKNRDVTRTFTWFCSQLIAWLVSDWFTVCDSFCILCVGVLLIWYLAFFFKVTLLHWCLLFLILFILA